MELNSLAKPTKHFYVQYRLPTRKGVGRIRNSKWFRETGAIGFALNIHSEHNKRPLVYIVEVDQTNPSVQMKVKFVSTEGTIEEWNKHYNPHTAMVQPHLLKHSKGLGVFK